MFILVEMLRLQLKGQSSFSQKEWESVVQFRLQGLSSVNSNDDRVSLLVFQVRQVVSLPDTRTDDRRDGKSQCRLLSGRVLFVVFSLLTIWRGAILHCEDLLDLLASVVFVRFLFDIGPSFINVKYIVYSLIVGLIYFLRSFSYSFSVYRVIL